MDRSTLLFHFLLWFHSLLTDHLHPFVSSPLLSSPLSAGLTFVSVHDCFWTHALTVDTMNKVSNHSTTFFLFFFFFFFTSTYPDCFSIPYYHHYHFRAVYNLSDLVSSGFPCLLSLLINWSLRYHMWYNSSRSLFPLRPGIFVACFCWMEEKNRMGIFEN